MDKLSGQLGPLNSPLEEYCENNVNFEPKLDQNDKTVKHRDRRDCVDARQIMHDTKHNGISTSPFISTQAMGLRLLSTLFLFGIEKWLFYE